MKRLLLLLMVCGLFVAGGAIAGERESRQHGQRGDKLKYNIMENEYSYESPDSRLKYNLMEDEYQYADPEDKLRYNIMEDRYEYSR